MKRKIVKLGQATLVTSLPSAWTKKYGLKQGDEVHIEEQERNLIIKTENEFGEDKIKLDITDLHPLINYGLSALYVRGVDEIDITSQNPEYIEKLQMKPINQFIGMEVIEQTKNRCVVKDVSGVKDMDFDMIVRRVFLILDSMCSEMYTAMKHKTSAEHVISIDANVNRFCFLCLRILNKRGYGEFRKTPIMFVIINYLEKTGDVLKEFAGYMSEHTISFSPATLKLFAEARSFLRDYQQIFFKFDKAKAVALDARYRAFVKSMHKQLEKTKSPKEVMALVYIRDLANCAAEMWRDQLTNDL